MKSKSDLTFRLAISFLLGVLTTAGHADTAAPSDGQALLRDVAYRPASGQDSLQRQHCRLDLLYPTDQDEFATVVWFHGGGLKSGDKAIPKALRKLLLGRSIAIASANYRLHPDVQSPAYVEDAAAAVAWVFQHIGRFGGDAKRIFVSGHSAGGYLTSMVGLDRRWLAAHDIDAHQIAGLIPYSGHAITHFTVRSERGIGGKQPIIDDMAPLYHVRGDAPPLRLITGDRELEMLGRYEENAYFARMMRVAGHSQTELFELDGFDHGGMVEPAHHLLLDFVTKHIRAK